MNTENSQRLNVLADGNECPRCHNHFVCEIKQGKERCWCMALPAITPVDGGCGCFCPACLTDVVAERTTAPLTDKM